MKFAVLQTNLAAVLKKVEPVVAKNTTLPILSFVKFEAKGRHIKLLATNLKVTIVTRCKSYAARRSRAYALSGRGTGEASIEQEGEAACPSNCWQSSSPHCLTGA